jgi:mRNA interferase MazF
MTNFDPGEIVVVRFPFTDLTSQKRRPAVVISTAQYSSRFGDVVLMPLTSQPQEDQRLLLKNWSECGLPKPTWAKPLLATLSRDLIDHIIGDLTLEDRNCVKAALSYVICDLWR